jgi:hypothetical protein
MQLIPVFCGRVKLEDAVRRALAVLSAAGCIGCMYPEPLAPGKAQLVDQRLVGAWRCVAPDSSGPAILNVTKPTEESYRAEFQAEGEKPSVFTGYTVTFEGKLLVNAQDVGAPSSRKWALARYHLYQPTVLHVEFARDEPFSGATTNRDRVAALKEHLEDPRLFEDYCTCVRVKER